MPLRRIAACLDVSEYQPTWLSTKKKKHLETLPDADFVPILMVEMRGLEPLTLTLPV